ncbi:energy transducer TonB [Mucilaginibacter sp. R-33]|uniref:energy transducer TonB n=1 Tax=unclassified Mucilaginibacter TaxID=2617802 RepID=UPI003CF6E6F5
MKRILLATIFAMMSLVVSAQTDTTKKIDTTFHSVEKIPEFPGGPEKLFRFIAKNLKYPTGETVEGRVNISFVIEKDGSLTDFKVVKSLSEATDAEAIRVMSISPKWQPGLQNGHPVRVRYSIPISFSSSN